MEEFKRLLMESFDKITYFDSVGKSMTIISFVYIYVDLLCRYEIQATIDWQRNITAELTLRLKQPLLVSIIYM